MTKKRFYDRLIGVLTAVNDRDDCALLLDDLCTIRELQEMEQRLETAILLSEGKNYGEICRLTGASTATISRVNRCLKYGEGGYAKAIAALKKGDKT